MRIGTHAEGKTQLCGNRAIGCTRHLPGQRKLLKLACIAKAGTTALVERIIAQFGPPVRLLVCTPFTRDPRLFEAGITHQAKAGLAAQAQTADTTAQAQQGIEFLRWVAAKGELHLFPDEIGRRIYIIDIK